MKPSTNPAKTNQHIFIFSRYLETRTWGERHRIEGNLTGRKTHGKKLERNAPQNGGEEQNKENKTLLFGLHNQRQLTSIDRHRKTTLPERTAAESNSRDMQEEVVWDKSLSSGTLTQPPPPSGTLSSGNVPRREL